MKEIINSFKNWKPFDYGLLLSAIVILMVIAFIQPQEGWALTLLASFCSITAGVLLYKGQQLGFAVYILYSILYIITSLKNHMYGEAILYGVYSLPMYIYSTIRWIKELKARENQHEDFLKIETVGKKELAIILAIGVSVTLAYGYILSIMNSAVPYLNSLGTVCCSTSIYMTNRKYKEQWWAWLSYSFVFAAIWMSNMTLTFAVQSMVFVVLNVCGLVNWKKMYRKQQSDEQ